MIRLQRDVFTVNTSFREEHYDDPDAQGRRLSEFTLVEAERDYRGFDWGHAFENLLYCLECLIKRVIKVVLDRHRREISLLGGNVPYLHSVLEYKFARIEYAAAIRRLQIEGFACQVGDDLDMKAERRVLEWTHGCPTFVIYHPASLKFFNMCRLWDGHPDVYSFDLLMPPLGETAGGGIRQPVGAKIKQALLESRVGDYLRDQGIDPLEPFAEYFRLFDEEEEINHGGFGIGFERFIAFLIGSNDILHTIAYRTLRPD